MKLWIAGTAVALWAALVPLQKSIDQDRRELRLNEESETVEELLVQAISDFRIAVSNFLWIRVDQYLHLYAMREELQHQQHEKDHGEPGHVHKEMTPEQARFRAQMESEVMPLVRIVTWLDPHFVLAYQVGAWTLGDRLKKPEEAEKFLKEGIRHNPAQYDLYSELGFTYFFYMKNYRAAAIAFGRALSFHIDDFNEKKKLVRMYAYCFEKSGEIDKAVSILEKYVKMDPKNKKAQQRLERLKQQLSETK